MATQEIFLYITYICGKGSRTSHSGNAQWVLDAFVIAANNRKEANTRPTARIKWVSVRGSVRGSACACVHMYVFLKRH